MSFHMSTGHIGRSHRAANDIGLSRLKEYVVFDAMHNSPKRMPHPKVHPNTRKTILDFIMNWVQNPDPEHDVLWLHAPFGHGKTAIMQQIAEWLHSSSLADHAGSFFFGQEEVRQDKAGYLIPTIVYQIAQNIPTMGAYINRAMIQDYSIPSKKVNIQLQRLILDPFHRCSPPLPNKPVVIIDELDGCIGMTEKDNIFDEDAKHSAMLDAQSCILDIITKAVSSPHCPLRFIIASRPEYQIKEAFRGQPLCEMSMHLELDRESDQGVNSFGNRREMMEYLRSGFNEICRRHSKVISTIEKPWPSNDDLWELVRKASGQYLFANSVLRFVGSGPESPVQRLKIILKQRHREKMKAFATMDHGYTRILAVCTGVRKYSRRIVRICAYMHSWEEHLTLSTLAEVLGCTTGEANMSFRGLHSLCDIDECNDIPDNIPWTIYRRHYSPCIRIRHISFIEFLLDKKRSGKWHLNPDAVQEWLMQRADKLLADGLSGRAQALLHPTTLKLVALLAAMDALSDHFDNNEGKDSQLGHFSHFPGLRKFLKSITETPFPIPDEPGKRFVESICTILSIFDLIGHKEAFENYIAICYDLLDQAWRKTTSFSPHFGTIVYSIMTHSTLSPDVPTISNALGMPLHETYVILDQYSCFTTLEQRVELLDHFRSFAENEFRSGPLHYHYRECWIRAILSYWRELLKEVPIFTPDSHSYQQLIEGFYDKPTISDINSGSDLQENSAMSDLIDFVHMIASCGESFVGENHYGVDIMALFIKWLVRQQKMLHPAHKRYSDIAIKLRAIVKNIDWNRLIHGVFSVFLRLTPSGALVLPLRVYCHNARPRKAVQIYPYILQLINSNTVPTFKDHMISGISHTIISEFFLHALLAFYHHEIGIDEWMPLYVPILINNVHWHYHLSHATFTEEILLSILSVHHIFIRQQDATVSHQERLTLDTLKRLGRTSFADGVGIWLKKHIREGNNLEWWVKGIPGCRLEQGKSDSGNITSAPNTGTLESSIPTSSARFKRMSRGSSTSDTAGPQVNLPSISTAAAENGNLEPVAKRLKTARK